MAEHTKFPSTSEFFSSFHTFCIIINSSSMFNKNSLFSEGCNWQTAEPAVLEIHSFSVVHLTSWTSYASSHLKKKMWEYFMINFKFFFFTDAKDKCLDMIISIILFPVWNFLWNVGVVLFRLYPLWDRLKYPSISFSVHSAF